MQTVIRRQYTKRHNQLGIEVRDYAQADRTLPKNLKTVKAAIESKPKEHDLAEVSSFSRLWMAQQHAGETKDCLVCEIVLKNKANSLSPLIRFLISTSENKIVEEKDYFKSCDMLVSWRMIERNEFLRM